MLERAKGSTAAPIFNFCCTNGKVSVSAIPDPPTAVLDLFTANTAQGKEFRKHSRSYNISVAYSSAQVHQVQPSSGISYFTIQGEIVHRIPSGLLPVDGRPPVFAQMYILDSEQQVDVRQRQHPHLNTDTLRILTDAIREVNPYAGQFTPAAQLAAASTQHYDLRICHANPQSNYAPPQTDTEIAALLPEVDVDLFARQIILRKHATDAPIRIPTYDRRYDPLHYVLLHINGSSGWHPQLRCSQREFYCHRLMVRENDFVVLRRSGRLMQQYIVDQYAKLEHSRLRFLRHNQTRLKAYQYNSIDDSPDGSDNSSHRLPTVPGT